MKTILKRTLLVTLLATSISAFAQCDDGKRDDAATPTNVTQQNDCNGKANDGGKQDEQKSSDSNKSCDAQKSSDEQQIKQEDNDWLHDLQGIYGG